MLLKAASFATPEENLLYDEVLLRLANQGRSGEALRFWESEHVFIVLGRLGRLDRDVRRQITRKDGVPVFRRASGGGTVVQGPGCLNYTLILSKERPEVADLRRSYQFILGKLINVLSGLGVEAAFWPISDMAVRGTQKKFSGNAQKRGRRFILHHGTILYCFDLTLIERYLTMPDDMPAYRQHRRHRDFVTNVPINPQAFCSEVGRCFGVERTQKELSPQEKTELAALKRGGAYLP